MLKSIYYSWDVAIARYCTVTWEVWVANEIGTLPRSHPSKNPRFSLHVRAVFVVDSWCAPFVSLSPPFILLKINTHREGYRFPRISYSQVKYKLVRIVQM